MADENVNGAASPEQAAGPQFAVQKIYVKDVSFESPGAPEVFSQPANPDISMNLNQRVNPIADGAYEVVLKVTITCAEGDKTLYLAEVEQAGIFALSGFESAQLEGMLGSYCPNMLYPYARQTISNLVQDGGFPPFLLQPLNFDAIYAEQMRRRVEEHGMATSDNLGFSPPVGNA